MRVAVLSSEGLGVDLGLKTVMSSAWTLLRCRGGRSAFRDGLCLDDLDVPVVRVCADWMSGNNEVPHAWPGVQGERSQFASDAAIVAQRSKLHQLLSDLQRRLGLRAHLHLGASAGDEYRGLFHVGTMDRIAVNLGVRGGRRASME